MISEKTLRSWRRDALSGLPKLQCEDDKHTLNNSSIAVAEVRIGTLNARILRLTQELMDIHLINKP